jgi:subtilisin family serine protease
MQRFHMMVIAMFVLLSAPIDCFATFPKESYRQDRILLKPKPGVSETELSRFHSEQGTELLSTFDSIGGIQVVRVQPGENIQALITRYTDSGLVEFAEPDYLIHAAAIPNDPKFLDGTLWGLQNDGQDGGVEDADIDAPEGWELRTCASNIIVAVLDTGIRYTHEDLVSNMWVNPFDGGHGFNAFTGTNDPADDNGHGTRVAGVIGAMGNNGIGVTGVAWEIQLMACKCLDDTGSGSDSTLIACIEYAWTNGARIINASLDSPSFSDAVSNAIVAVRSNGIFFVASAGNDWKDVDAMPRYPACYDLDNIVSVAYTTRNDDIGILSNYGLTNVDLAAPGEEIYSTDALSDSAYFPTNNATEEDLSGTSYAAAYVSGTLALILERFPVETYQQTIGRLFLGVDPLPALEGKCATGGRLNLRKALSAPITLIALPWVSPGPFQLQVVTSPNRTCVIETSSNLTSWYAIYTNTTSSLGTFDFVDVTNGPRRFFRATAAP